nr:unnamed protein product [Callosobruchus chinensis]
MKCNSGDSGIHIEMVPDCGGSSEGASSSNSSCPSGGGGGGCPSGAGGDGSSRSSASGGSSGSPARCQRHHQSDDAVGATPLAAEGQCQRQSGNVAEEATLGSHAYRRRRNKHQTTSQEGGLGSSGEWSSSGGGGGSGTSSTTHQGAGSTKAGGRQPRPHSELLNQVLFDKFKADLRQHHLQQQWRAGAVAAGGRVRRTRSDLGEHPVGSYRGALSATYQHALRRQMAFSSSSPSPHHHPSPAATAAGHQESAAQVVFRTSSSRVSRLSAHHHRLRRSLSQPLDMDKLASSPTPPLMVMPSHMVMDVKGSATDVRPGETNYSEDELDHHRSHYTSDSETMSDSESSMASLTDHGRRCLDNADSIDKKVMVLAEAVFDHVAIEPEELAFRSGDLVEVLEANNRDWWWGSSGGRSGWFPAHFVRLRVNQEDTVEDCLAAMASGVHRLGSSRRTSVSLLSNDEVRANVLSELVNTERDFVKVLQDICEGYVRECRKRADMFSEELVRTIFVNLEDILDFQRDFLADLEACGDNVGVCFLKHRTGFKMYSDYCNSHPMATAQLMELYQSNNYSKFFEACRLLRGLMEIPLDGYLLTPVQRICKYPLQLAELLKYTRSDHEDYENIKEALEAMRGVAVLINERKRKMESLEKLAAWQMRVEGWEGEDLIDLSSQLIYQSEVVRVNTGMWTNNIMLFLFDHQIICCKKNIFKRHTYVYKGRICLDTCEVIDVLDGKDIHLGCTVRHAIRLVSNTSDSSASGESLLFCCRSAGDKQRWLRALAEERRQVAHEAACDSDLGLAPAARRLAQATAAAHAQAAARGKSRRPTRKPRSRRTLKHSTGYTGSALQLNTNNNSLGKKVGGWFSFGTNKKTRHQHPEVP